MNRTSCGRQFERIVAEIVECQIECKRCHNVFGFIRPHNELDENIHGKDGNGTEYDQTGNNTLVFIDIQNTLECQNLYGAVENLSSRRDLMDVTYQEIASNINHVQRFNILDITHFRKNDSIY